MGNALLCTASFLTLPILANANIFILKINKGIFFKKNHYVVCFSEFVPEELLAMIECKKPKIKSTREQQESDGFPLLTHQL